MAYQRYRQTNRTSSSSSYFILQGGKIKSNPQRSDNVSYLLNRKKLVTQLTAAMKRCFAAQSIFQNMMFCNVDGAAVLLLTVPVGSCSCEAAELSFSCPRRLKTWSKGGRRVCGKGMTFMHCFMDKSNAVSLPPLFCHPGCDDGRV